MAARKFKFVSPGVFLKEIDNSQLPKLPGNNGPVIIGRTRKGPALNPVKVNSYADFVEVFGEPIPGGRGDDVWREGNGLLATAYASYAAKAYFGADIRSPVTMIRLLGVQGDNATAEALAQPGWTVNNAYALVTYESGSMLTGTVTNHNVSAVFYFKDDTTSVRLLGSAPNGDLMAANTGSHPRGATPGNVVKVNEAGQFRLLLSSSDDVTKEVAVDFTEGSKNYIRSALNTNPVLTNTDVSYIATGALADRYWLGETFESHAATGSTGLGYIIKLQDATYDFTDYTHEASAARSGWIISQHQGTAAEYAPLDQQRLFRLIALSEGEQPSKDVVVSIEDIRVSETGDVDPYGSFSVVVKRKIGTRLEVVESYPGCNLNPNSQNYVARRVGDQYFQWSSVEKRNKVYGNYTNNSQHIRVEMESNTDQGLISPSNIPFGFLGPIVPKRHTKDATNGRVAIGATDSFVHESQVYSSLGADIDGTFNIIWPSTPTTFSGSVRGLDYFGAAIYKKSGLNLTSELDPVLPDYNRKMPTGLTTAQTTGEVGARTEHAYVFSLDDVRIEGHSLSPTSTANVTAVYYKSGSRADATSFTAVSSSTGISDMLELGFDKFQMPLCGGFDGVNITEPDPFANRILTAGGSTADSYAFASVDRAIELIKDPEMIEHNIAAMPGITNASLTSKLVEKCESRADSLAVIDLPDVYKPPHELKCTSFADRIGTTPEAAAKALKARQINSSYGATYYPWVKVRDNENSRDVWVPPSVVALGVMAYTEQASEVWFAPAGFNRGGLNEGNAGIPVLQASEQLLSKQRDALYESNINPIASFVTEGLVIFGQKTLQSTPSALDRINVRRLLIFVKKEVSRIANGLLFDQNVPATWNRFLGQVNPFLQSVKTRLGLSDFKVILDNTTTTPDLVDRNVMYAKIFLKPARAIEFIAVDFVITNTGASFDD